MSEIKKICDQCKKKTPLADTFIYKEESYCMDCLYSLLMELAEDGKFDISFLDCEDEGIQVW